MNDKSTKSTVRNTIGWVFGAAVFAIGVLNVFWGNDPGFGVFLLLLSGVFFPPANTFLTEKTGFTLPVAVKILLGIFIVWAALGVGELPAKIDLLLRDVR